MNTSTGKATLLSQIGVPAAGDLAFHEGRLYLSALPNQLVEIDRNDYTVMVIGSMGFSNVFGMATGDDGILYGVSGTRIFRIDTQTGAGTLILDYAGRGLGPANGTSFTTEAIPEASSMVLTGISAALLAMGAGRTILTTRLLRCCR